MLKSRICNFFLIFSLVASNAFANSYLRPEFLKVIKYACLVEEKSVVFCTDQDITDPHLIIRLPLLEPIVLSNGVHAFRINDHLTFFDSFSPLISFAKKAKTLFK